MNESWMQVISICLANAGLIIWFRTESRNDWRHMDAKFDGFMKAIREDVKAIQEEIKDFHSRLCEIEAGRKK